MRDRAIFPHREFVGLLGISFRNPERMQDLRFFFSTLSQLWQCSERMQRNPIYPSKWTCTKKGKSVSSKFGFNALGSALCLYWENLNPFPAVYSIYLPVAEYSVRKGLLWRLLPSDFQALLVPPAVPPSLCHSSVFLPARFNIKTSADFLPCSVSALMSRVKYAGQIPIMETK